MRVLRCCQLIRSISSWESGSKMSTIRRSLTCSAPSLPSSRIRSATAPSRVGFVQRLPQALYTIALYTIVHPPRDCRLEDGSEASAPKERSWPTRGFRAGTVSTSQGRVQPPERAPLRGPAGAYRRDLQTSPGRRQGSPSSGPGRGSPWVGVRDGVSGLHHRERGAGQSPHVTDDQVYLVRRCGVYLEVPEAPPPGRREACSLAPGHEGLLQPAYPRVDLPGF